MTNLLVDPAIETTRRTNRTSLFVREFARHPLTTASLVPSSPALADAMIADRRVGQVVVELGPGSGAFTVALQRLSPARHVAFERNKSLAGAIATDFPDVDIALGDADELSDLIHRRGLSGKVDQVVSGLPWQAYAGDAGPRLIAAVADALRPGGSFQQFTYSWTRWAPPAHRQLHGLHRRFGSVSIGRTIWRNFPPATVYTCRQPIRSGNHDMVRQDLVSTQA